MNTELNTSAELATVLARLDELTREVSRLTAQLERKDARRERELTRELDEQRQECERLRASVERLTAENELLGSRAAATAYEAANLRQALSEVWNSLSWRITAPLRWITRPLFNALSKPATPESSAAGRASAAGEPSRLEPVLAAVRAAERVAIIPCAVPFSSALNQRPVSYARYLADHGWTVVYVAWQWSPGEEIPRAFKEVYRRVWEAPLYAFQENAGAVAAASPAESVYVCTLPSPGLVAAAEPLRQAGYHIHYDIMDDWEEFHRNGQAPWFSAAVEREAVTLADTVSAVSPFLARKFADIRSDIALVRNGYDPAAMGCPQFIAARTPLAGPPTVGYFGHLTDAWFDWETVFHAAEMLPDVQFELIGYGVTEKWQKRVDAAANVRFVGMVPQSELHNYARTWWAGMIPFRPSALAEAVDPLKIYEYLHLGLPSVVTGISGIADYPLVAYAEDAASFTGAVKAVKSRPDEATLARVAEFLRECVWDERFGALAAMAGDGAALPFLYRKPAASGTVSGTAA